MAGAGMPGRWRGWGLAALLGAVLGVVGWGGFNTVMEATNRMEFCISCHEMRDNVYVEYKKSSHYENPSGVRAVCADCHVPREWTHKLLRKAAATVELYHWLIGSIDTPEKFAAKRHELARHEWARMQASDSRECRNCHAFEAMSFHKQSPKAAKVMSEAMKAGRTCIDCHKGIAHAMPDVAAGHRRRLAELTAAAVQAPAAGATAYPLGGMKFYLNRPSGDDGAGRAADGEIHGATPVAVQAVAGGFVQVDISGWRREGSEEILYARPGQRAALAALGEAAATAAVTGDSVADPDSGLNWTAARLTVWTAVAGYVGQAAPLWDYAAMMYDAQCGLCHRLHPPEKYTANEWIANVNAMKRLTPLREDETRLLLAWLQRHGKDAAPAP